MITAEQALKAHYHLQQAANAAICAHYLNAVDKKATEFRCADIQESLEKAVAELGFRLNPIS